MKPALTLIALLRAPLASVLAIDYPHVTAEPQKTGFKGKPAAFKRARPRRRASSRNSPSAWGAAGGLPWTR